MKRSLSSPVEAISNSKFKSFETIETIQSTTKILDSLKITSNSTLPNLSRADMSPIKVLSSIKSPLYSPLGSPHTPPHAPLFSPSSAHIRKRPILNQHSVLPNNETLEYPKISEIGLPKPSISSNNETLKITEVKQLSIPGERYNQASAKITITPIPPLDSKSTTVDSKPKNGNNLHQEVKILLTSSLNLSLPPNFIPIVTIARSRATFANLGNTCFLNSVLQCLFATDLLISRIKHSVTRELNINSISRGVVAYEFNELWNLVQEGKSSIRPLQLKRAIAKLSSQFDNYEYIYC